MRSTKRSVAGNLHQHIRPLGLDFLRGNRCNGGKGKVFLLKLLAN